MSVEELQQQDVATLVAAGLTAQGRGPDAVGAVLTALQAVSPCAERHRGEVRALVRRLWFTPWQLPAGPQVAAREAAWLAPTSPQGWSTPAGRLRGFAGGAGPTVLLLHGWGDHAGRMGAFVGPLLDRGFRVVGCDLPAHGGNSGETTDLYVIAEAVAAVLEAERPAGVVAHSLGGQALLRALAQDTDHVAAVALLAPAVRLESAVARFRELFGVSEPVMAELVGDFVDRFGEVVWRETDATAAAPAVDAPVLLASSDDDEQVPPADTEALTAAFPRCTRLRVSGLGHTRVLRDPDVVTSVADFLTEHLHAGRS